MHRGLYAKNLTKEIKIRIDDDTFKQITETSEKQEKTRSLFLREIITNHFRLKC